jgi:hypothetical protein
VKKNSPVMNTKAIQCHVAHQMLTPQTRQQTWDNTMHLSATAWCKCYGWRLISRHVCKSTLARSLGGAHAVPSALMHMCSLTCAECLATITGFTRRVDYCHKIYARVLQHAGQPNEPSAFGHLIQSPSWVWPTRTNKWLDLCGQCLPWCAQSIVACIKKTKKKQSATK